MKKYIALFLVILIITSFAGCANAVYKRGVGYDSFPEDEDFIYDNAIVFNYKEKNNEVQLEYGSKDDVDDIIEYYQDLLEDSDYIIYEEEVDNDEYKAKGRSDEWEFDIEVEEARHNLSEFYDTVVTIELEQIEGEQGDQVKNEVEDTSSIANDSSQEKDDNPDKQIKISDEDLFFEGIKNLTLRQLDNMDSNLFEGLFLSSLYDKLNNSSYNLNFEVETSNYNSDNESMDLYVQTLISQSYSNGESSMEFIMGEDRDNTLTNSMYFTGSNCYIKKSDPDIPVRRYTSSRQSDYFNNSTFQQRLYATFASQNSSLSAKEEYSPIVDSYLDIIKNHIDKSMLNSEKSSLTLLEDETECYTINATLEGTPGYKAINDLFFTMKDDENMQHLFGYIIYDQDHESYKQNKISAICNAINDLTEDEIDGIKLHIQVITIDNIPIKLDFQIETHDKSLDYSILEYVNGAESHRHMNYKAFDESYDNKEERTIEINQGEYENYLIISSSDKKLKENNYFVIETLSKDSDDGFDSETVITGDQTSPEDGQVTLNITLNWYINKQSPNNYFGNGILYMQQNGEDGENTIDGNIQMILDFTDDVYIAPITYIDEVGVSVSTHKDLFTEMVGVEEELQNDISTRFIGQLIGFFISYS